MSRGAGAGMPPSEGSSPPWPGTTQDAQFENLLDNDVPPHTLTTVTLTTLIHHLFRDDWPYAAALDALDRFADHPATFTNNNVPDPNTRSPALGRFASPMRLKRAVPVRFPSVAGSA